MNEPPLDAQAALAVSRALADPQRYRIMRLLAQAPANTPCSTLFEAIGLAPATLSHHMKELRDAGLIAEHRVGRTVQYQIRFGVVVAFLRVLERDLLPATNEGDPAYAICNLS